MKNELFKLAMQGLKGKRRSSLLTALVLTISFAAALVTLCITGSIAETNSEYRLNTYGAWYGAIPCAFGGDEEFLSSADGVGRIGKATVCGQIASESGANVAAIGTADENLTSLGRIGLQDGEFPKKENEIALEASVLSKLGKDYTIGQELTLTVLFDAVSDGIITDEKLSAECSFTLCGVLREYSNLWLLSENKQMKPLCGALITEAAAAKLQNKAVEAAAERNAQAAEGTETVSAAAANQQLFFEIDEAERTQTVKIINAYMQESRRGTNADKAICVNSAAFSDNGEANYHSLYILMIIAVTVIAVVCIYAVQLQKQVRGIALFRSIGITKRQLRLLLTFETLILALPAAVIGAALGAFGVKLILKLFVYAKSAPVKVAIPWSQLAFTALCWFASIFAARMAVFRVALSEPLTGRMHTARSCARAFDLLRRAAVMLLAAIFCAAVITGFLESLYPRTDMRSWQNKPAYIVNTESQSIAFFGEGRAAQLITQDMVDIYEAIPGITKAVAMNEMTVELTFDGAAESAVFAAMREEDPQFEEGAAVYLYAATAENVREIIDSSGIDAAAWAEFSSGEGVIVSFPIATDGGVFFNRVHYGAPELSAGDELSVGFYGTKRIWEGDKPALGTNKKLLQRTVKVAAVTEFEYENTVVQGAYQPFTIFCSDTFLKKVLSECEADNICGNLITGTQSEVEAGYGMSFALVYTDLNAGYVSTDYVLAENAAKHGMQMSNSREVYASYIQGDLQKLILIYSGCGCIALVMLLLIGNILALEAAGEERKYAILRAIGMSKHQLKMQLNVRALLRSAASVLCGWLVYAAYLLASAISHYKNRPEVGADMTVFDFVKSLLSGLALGGANALTVVLLTVCCTAALVLLSMAAKRRLLNRNLAAMLRERA